MTELAPPLEENDWPLGYTKDGRRRWKNVKLRLRNDPGDNDLVAKVVDLRLAGHAWKVIAEKLEVDPILIVGLPDTARYKEIYKERSLSFREEQRLKVISAVPDALNTLIELSAKATSEHVRYEAANALLVHSQVLEELAENGSDQNDYRKALNDLKSKARRLDRIQVNVGVVNTPGKPPHIETSRKLIS